MNDFPFTIQLARFEDMPSVREVAIQSYEATFAAYNTRKNMDDFYQESYNLAKLQEEFLEPQSIIFLVYKENNLAGFMRLRKNDEVANQLGDNTIELHRLYIHPDYQGKKIGKVLMNKALEYATELKVDWIWLGVWEKNFKAHVFYFQFGFERFGDHIFQMGDDPQIDWLMRKRIA